MKLCQTSKISLSCSIMHYGNVCRQCDDCLRERLNGRAPGVLSTWKTRRFRISTAEFSDRDHQSQELSQPIGKGCAARKTGLYHKVWNWIICRLKCLERIMSSTLRLIDCLHLQRQASPWRQQIMARSRKFADSIQAGDRREIQETGRFPAKSFPLMARKSGHPLKGWYFQGSRKIYKTRDIFRRVMANPADWLAGNFWSRRNLSEGGKSLPPTPPLPVWETEISSGSGLRIRNWRRRKSKTSAK